MASSDLPGTWTHNIGSRLKYIREARGYSQKELAVKAELSQSTIAQIETGKKDASISTLRKLAIALDTDVATLFASDTVHVFDLPRLRRRYPTVDNLTASLYAALGKVVQYAEDIGFVKPRKGISEEDLTISKDQLVNRYLEFVTKNKPSRRKGYEGILQSEPSAIVAEAAVFEVLRNAGKISLAEGDNGGPDFLCESTSGRFFVEVTCLTKDAVTRATGLADNYAPGASAFGLMTPQIKSAVGDKQRQLSGLDAPAVVAVCSDHSRASLVLGELAARFLMTGTEKMSIPVGAIESNASSKTSLEDSLFFAFEKNRSGIKPCRQASSAVLLISIHANGCNVLGLLHPEPQRPFPIDLLPGVPFARITNWPFKEGHIELEWVIGQPAPKRVPFLFV